MPQRCEVYGCRETRWKKSSDDISFHKFPRDAATKQRWINFVKSTRPYWNGVLAPTSAVCGKHFSTTDYESANVLSDSEGIIVTKRLRRDSVPSVPLESQVPVPLQSTGESSCGSQSVSIEDAFQYTGTGTSCGEQSVSEDAYQYTAPTVFLVPLRSTGESVQSVSVEDAYLYTDTSVPLVLQSTGANFCNSSPADEDACTSVPLVGLPRLPSQHPLKTHKVKTTQTNKVHIKYRSRLCQTTAQRLRNTGCQTLLTMKDIARMEAMQNFLRMATSDKKKDMTPTEMTFQKGFTPIPSDSDSEDDDHGLTISSLDEPSTATTNFGRARCLSKEMGVLRGELNTWQAGNLARRSTSSRKVTFRKKTDMLTGLDIHLLLSMEAML